MIQSFALEHVGLCVESAEKTFHWYRDIFGFELVKTFEKPDMELKGMLIRNANCFLELIEPNKKILDSRRADRHQDVPASNEMRAGKALRDLGTNHIAIKVSPIVEVFSYLKEKEVEMVSDLIDNRIFFCRDIDGNLIEVRG